MKRLLPLALMMAGFFAISQTLQAQDTTFVEVWAHYGETAPAWFTDGSEAEIGDNSWSGTERGIAYSKYSGHVYVSSRHADDTDGDGEPDGQGEPHIYVLDPATGEAPAFGVSKLLTTGITSADENFGGGYPLNNVVTTEDGSIFACNMTLASGPDIIGDDDAVTVKAFRVYRWDWEQGIPTMIIDYKEGGYRLGDKFSVLGNWETEAYIYAAPSESNKLLRWKVTAGVVDDSPTVITLQDVSSAGTSINVADVPGNDDWIYVSGKGFLPTLFTRDGVNLTQVAISPDNLNSSLLAGRTIEFGGRLYMAMFCGDQSAFIIDLTKHGENVTDADIVGYTPTFGTKFDNAYGEGAVDIAAIDNNMHVFVCAPSNGIACYKIEGISNVGIKDKKQADFNLSAYPNPASDMATVKFTLPENAKGAVALKLYDVTGKFITISPAKAFGGEQELVLNTSDLATGTYLYQVVYDNQVSQGKLLIK